MRLATPRHSSGYSAATWLVRGFRVMVRVRVRVRVTAG